MRWLGLLVICACTGDITGGGGTPPNNPGGPDASTGSGSGSGSGSNQMDAGVTLDAPAFACRNKVTTYGSGHHNAGQNCMSSCHDHGFSLAGTLYSAVNGTTPQAGATITAIDANGATIDLVAQQNGNFYTTQAVAFPVSVTASECPTIAPMTSKVTSADGGCNKSGCHVAGAVGVIHLP